MKRKNRSQAENEFLSIQSDLQREGTDGVQASRWVVLWTQSMAPAWDVSLPIPGLAGSF